LLPQRASLKRASKAADPNFVLWVEIKIFYLAHCMTVPVNFYRGAVRSGIRKIGNVIIFHLWASFMESHSWLKVIKRHFVGCFSHYTAVLSALYSVLSPLYAVVPALYAVLSPFILNAVLLQLYAVCRALYAVLLTLYAIPILSFNIISTFFP
jgi:hypothetical protein